MSSIQTKKIVLESTGNNVIEYLENNTYIFTAGGANVFVINSSSSSFKANGSVGTAGQFLTSDGTITYWSNVAAQSYTWSNTHTFQNAITFSTNVSIGGVTNANTSGVFTTATINSPAYTVGSSLIANTSGVYHTGTMNAAIVSVGSSLIANTTGVYHTGTINAAIVSVGSNIIANTTQLTIASGVGLSANGSLGTNGQFLISNGSSPYWATLSTGGLSPNVVSSNTTATKGNFYVATASLTLTLPASPLLGDIVGFQNSSNTTTCVIARNSSNIMSLAENLTIDTKNTTVQLIYADATRGWVFY